MKKNLLIFATFCLLFLSSGVFAQTDLVFRECPSYGKACRLRGNDFKTLRDRTILKCENSKKLADILGKQVGNGSTEILAQGLSVQGDFNRAVTAISIFSATCSRDKYEQTESIFDNTAGVISTALRDEIRRLNSEGKTIEAKALQTEISGLQNVYHDVLDGIDLNSNLAAIPSSENIFGSGDGKVLGYETSLRDYTGAEQTGSEQFRGIVETLLGFFKKAMVPLAIFMIAVAGVELFSTRGDQSEETVKKKKNTIMGIATGFFIFFLAVNAIDWVIFGTQGQILRGVGEDGAVEFAKRGFAEMEGLYNYLATFVTIVGVAFVVMTAVRLIFSGGDEAMETTAKKQIILTISGVAVIISLKPILRIFTSFDGEFVRPTATPVIEFMAKWADYLLGFLGIIAVIALIYGGVRLILDFGNGEAQEKAKKTIMYAILGLILAFSTWTIVNFFSNPSGTGTQTNFETIYTTPGQ